ncbi:MAG: glycosyltransferase family 39 protein [Chloroflexota bacterium]|nr:glycosyltransferase family 39 protein [Chloroflexota bacterium]MDQ5864202.1 glycosyltransferase family 39 protein [Chloroflexota bacterium]
MPGLTRARLALCIAFILLSPALLLARWQLSPPQPVYLDLGNPATSASHFYGVERAADRGFRWSREMSAVSLPALASSVNISLTLDPARPAGMPLPTAWLRIGDSEIASFETSPGWQTYSANTGPGFSPDVRLVLESGTFYPGAGDRRLLGVAVSEIAISVAPNRFGLSFPPLLWLLLAAVTPALCLGLVSMFSRSVRMRLLWGVVSAAAALPLIFCVFAPTSLALPLYSWLVASAAAIFLLLVAKSLLNGESFTLPRLQRLVRSRWELPIVGGATGLLAVGATWPLVTRLTDSLPGWPADNFAFLYKLWWFRTALLEEHRSPFFDPGSYAPFGFDLGQGEPTLANAIPGVLLGAITNDVVAYNLLALASFVISGIGAYLLVKELTGSRSAAMLSALAFAFCPYRMSQFAGHLQLLGTGWIALAFYFLERLLKTGKARDGVFLGLSYGLAALSAWYYAYMVGLALGLYLLLRVALGGYRGDLRRLAGGLVAGAALFLLLASPVAIPSLQLWAQGGLTHSAKAADEHSAAPADYLVLNPLQPIWGEAGMRAHAEQNVIESALYVGIPLAGVIISGCVLLWRRVQRPERRLWGSWLALAAVAFVLSLGLTLHGASGQVRVGQTGVIPLPGQLLYDWMPLYSSMRAFARFGVIVALALTVVLGLLWAASLRNGPPLVRRNPIMATLVLALLLLADFWTGPYAWGTSRVEARGTARFLAEQPPGLVMQMPLDSSQSGPALYRRVQTGKPIAYGYETFEPPAWRAERDNLQEFPEAASLDVLRRWGVRYVVVSGKPYGADWPGVLDYLKSLPQVRFLAEFQDRSVWQVDPQVLDARPDMGEYATPDDTAVFELLP